MAPPPLASTKKLFKAPHVTLNDALVPVSDPDVFVALIANDPVLLIFTVCDASTPAVKAAVVPLPCVRVPVELILTVPVNVFVPELQVLFSASRAVS